MLSERKHVKAVFGLVSSPGDVLKSPEIEKNKNKRILCRHTSVCFYDTSASRDFSPNKEVSGLMESVSVES